MKELTRKEAHDLRLEYKEGFELWQTDYEKQRDHHVKQFIEWLYNTGRKIKGKKYVSQK